MNQRDLGQALLSGETIDVREMTQRVLRRDRRRVWVLGHFCIIAWMLVVMLPWSTVLPMLAKIAEYQKGQNVAPGPAPMSAQEQAAFMGHILHDGIIATFIGSLATMFIAAVCTVLFITVSRRATLRQVNARLGEISEQLKLLAGKPL